MLRRHNIWIFNIIVLLVNLIIWIIIFFKSAVNLLSCYFAIPCRLYRYPSQSIVSAKNKLIYILKQNICCHSSAISCQMIMSTCPIFNSTCQKITYISEWKLWSFWFCFWVFSNTIEYERTNGKSTDKVGMV